MPTWEAVTAIATLLSSIAVLAAVVVAVRQVRVGSEQVSALRRATELDGAMKAFALMTSPESVAAREFIVQELPQRLRDDPVYREELFDAKNLARHTEMPIMRLMEMMGIWVKHGLLDANVVFDYWVPQITVAWDILERQRVIAETRRRVHASMWENFEYIVRRYKRWEAERYDPAPQPEIVPEPAAP